MALSLPQVVVDATVPTAVWFSGEVPIDPGETATVNAFGYTGPVDCGDNLPASGIELRIDLQSVGLYSGVQFMVQTSQDLVRWYDAGSADEGPYNAAATIYLHFTTRRRYFRLAWSGGVMPVTGNPETYPAGLYRLVYVGGAFNYDKNTV